MRLGLKIWIAAAAALLAAMVQPVVAGGRNQAGIAIDLRKYGWEPPSPHEVDRPAVAVDSQGRVLVGFTVRERSGLATRSLPNSEYRILRFTARGDNDLSLSLPTDAGGRTGLYLTASDEVIARANGNLKLFQAEEGNSSKGAWKLLAQCPLGCDLEQSFTLRTLLLYQPNAVTIIRATPDPQVRPCRQGTGDDGSQGKPQAITDDFAYFSGSQEGVARGRQCADDRLAQLPLHFHGRWNPVSDNAFVATPYDDKKNRSGLQIVALDGSVKFRAELGKHESADITWFPIRSSERGERIAAFIYSLRGDSRVRGLPGYIATQRIAVYDVATGKELLSVRSAPKHRYRFDYALSANGRWLAILEDDTVWLFEVTA